MKTRLILFENPGCQLHDTGPVHPENRGRLEAIGAAIRSDAELSRALERRRADNALQEDLLRVHTPEHVASVRDAVARARRDHGIVWLDEDTAVSGGSWDAAIASAGCAIAAVEAVLDGTSEASFALSRPPGHHASAHRAMGFCLFNNVAIAVRRAQARGLAGKVLVVDFDAHHGNGTQDVFYDDPRVVVMSLHLSPHFPETGSATERGIGAGQGATRNVPLAAGIGWPEYRAAFADALDATLADFTPELVVLSAGFDGLEGDPEGGLRLVPADLHRLVTELLARLPAGARVPVAGVLEGGYALHQIGAGVAQVLRALARLPAQENSDAR